MKKLIILLSFSVFCATALLTQAFAAPAQNTRQGATKRVTTQKAGSQRATTNRSTQQRAAQQRATQQRQAAQGKSQERKEAQNQEFGLMPSELDSRNHSVFHADASAIKGARDTESALRYLPFVTITNTAGFGSQFDLRGQGRVSSNGVKLYINGIAANPVDSYYKYMPMNMILPSLIQEIAVSPGGGAVLYGAGAKGGTINIITSQRGAPSFVAGAGYVNTMATEGHSFNAYALANENLSTHLKVNAGLGFNQMGGPREGDSSWVGQAVVGAWYDIGWGQSVSVDADFSMGKTKTTPYNSLIDFNEIVSIMRQNTTTNNPYQKNEQQQILSLQNSTPTKNDRATKGMGEIETTQMRATAKLGWESQLTGKLKLNVDAFGAIDNKKYDKYILNLPYFILGNYDPTRKKGHEAYWDMMFPRPNSSTDRSEPLLYNGQRGDWHLLDQTGSSFNESKFGAMGLLNWQHDNGELNFGVSYAYEMGRRHTQDYLRSSMALGNLNNTGGAAGTTHPDGAKWGFEANVDSKFNIDTMTTAVFVLERYDLNRNFSVTGGMRYELKNYNVKYDDKFTGARLEVVSQNDYSDVKKWGEGESRVIAGNPEFKQNFDNFTFELSPVFKYSNTGAIYGRAEMGYIAPPAWAMIQRWGRLNNWTSNYAGQANKPASYDFGYSETNLESETYWTAELGFKELIGTRRVPLVFTNLTLNALLFSANLFYTDSQNEFYFEGDNWSGMQYKNYSKSRRMGAEVALEQYLFDGALGFNESFTYVRAQYQDNGEWATIPYTYDYKATLGANINVTSWLEVVDVAVNIWLQNSIYGNQTIYSRSMMVTNNDGQDTAPVYGWSETTSEKLKPYVISDFGVSVGLNKNMGVVTVGIKNLFDTLYYDYYNNDRASVVHENRYVVGRGRTVFVEGTFRY